MPDSQRNKDDLATRVQELEILTGFQERTLANLHAEVLTFAQRVHHLEEEMRRLRESRASTSEQEPFDEDDRVPSCG